jgi:hypothetical protein
MSRPSLDWSDPIAVARWLTVLQESFDDADAVVLDMLLPRRERELGPALHVKSYIEAREKILQAFEYATAPGPEPDGGASSDPAGSGGAGPAH